MRYLFLILVFICNNSFALNISASSAYLINERTNEVLFSKNIRTPHLPASTTKLLTALIAYENLKNKNKEIVILPTDTKVQPSSVPLLIGEKVYTSELLKSILIGSDNDSAMALSRHIGGSTKNFLVLMNSRCKELGCKNSNFINPHGLPASGQYTTAYDLMLIFRAVLSYPELRKITATRSFELRTKVGKQIVKNHNRLLFSYKGMGSAKTGWTVKSRHTYAASVIRDNTELLLVLLNSPNKWNDAKVLFDYGFSSSKTK